MSGLKISDVGLAAWRSKQIAGQRAKNETLLKGAISSMRLVLGDARWQTAALGPYQAEASRHINGLEKRFVAVTAEAGQIAFGRREDRRVCV